MRMSLLPLLAVLLLAGGAGAARIEVRQMDVNDDQVSRWNHFVDHLYRVHLQRVAAREVRTESRIGGYHRHPDFYEEVRYIDARSGHLLSVILWEREGRGLLDGLLQRFRPEDPQAARRRIHSITVYDYDAEGRVSRDYSGTYLPRHKNAPIQTLIAVHHYNGALHAFRSFDASGARVYEVCRGRYQGRRVSIELDEDDLAVAEDDPGSILNQPVYRACFGGLQATAGTEDLLPR